MIVDKVHRILVAEDEALIAMLIETILVDAGYDMVAAGSVEEALDAIDRESFDAAILDLNLKGKKVYPVAEKLAAAGTPFIFATGGDMVVGFPDRPAMAKPFREEELMDAMKRLLGGTGTAV